MIYVTMVYAPIAAWLVELFPTRIRYSGLSLPYHIGNGWFGGFLPATVFAIVAATGNIYSGLWYPIVVAAMSFVVGLIFLPETKDRRHHQDLSARDGQTTACPSLYPQTCAAMGGLVNPKPRQACAARASSCRVSQGGWEGRDTARYLGYELRETRTSSTQKIAVERRAK